MGRGRGAGSGVLAWRTHRLEIKVDQAQYGRVGVLWGGAIFPSLEFFLVGIKVEKGRSKLIIRDNTQAGDWPIYVKLKLS